MALPWLESVPPCGATTGRGTPPPSRRCGSPCLFSGNGFHSKEWWAKGEGTDMELGQGARAARRRSARRCCSSAGSTTRRPCIGGIHSCQTGNLLTGAHLAPGGEIKSGVSCDQVIAEQHEGPDQGAEPGAGLRAVDRGDPQELLDDLQFAHLVEFADDADAAGTLPGPGVRPPVPRRSRQGRQERARRRAARTPAACSNSVSTADQRRLDEYLSSVREVEQRIEQAGKAGRLQGWRPTLDKPNMPRPADGIPQDIDQHMRLMCDILVLAFRTDTTRVCTLKLNNDHSSLRFPHLGSVDYMIHHLLSHTDGADWLKVNQFFTRAGGLHRREARRGAGRRAHAAGQHA